MAIPWKSCDTTSQRKVVKLMRYKIKEVPAGLSGIYKLTFPNSKIYIGLSNNINRRLWEHEHKHTNQPISKAIKKYGMPKEVDILLEGLKNRKDLIEQERYFIQLYKSNQKEIGYNLTQGGDGANHGVANIASIFTINDVYDIKNLLKNSKKSIAEIAKQYNCHSETISRINIGKHYYDSTIEYPIRDQYSVRVNGSQTHNAALNDQQVVEIIDLLENNFKLSMAAIARQFNVNPSIIRRLNRGETYFNIDRKYPIRETKRNI